MAEHGFTNPAKNPELAAQEIVIELIKAGAFTPKNPVPTAAFGQSVAASVTNAHGNFLSYYKALKNSD